MNQDPKCWCGNSELEQFSPAYLRCARCETLVTAEPPDAQSLLAGAGDSGFYGRAYHESYQVEKHGLPGLCERARTDLADRSVHWLATLVRYKPPPARVLELGSAHGGFVALMRWAGYEAEGLEMSPWLSEFAQETFGVSLLVGPLEQQEIAAGSLDAVVLMDVLEHLPDPLGTVRHCLACLKPDGILLIQTPRYREGMSLAEMESRGDRFREMLLPDQHLFLFSEQSVREFLGRLGAAHVRFEAPVFADYDMFLAASRGPLPCAGEDEIASALQRSPAARLCLALLDADRRYKDLLRRAGEMQAECDARLRAAPNRRGWLQALMRSWPARMVGARK